MLPVLAAANPIKTPVHIANLLFLFNFIKSWVQEHVDIYCIYTSMNQELDKSPSLIVKDFHFIDKIVSLT